MARTLIELKAARYEVQQKRTAIRQRGQELQTKYQADTQGINKELEEVTKEDLRLEGAIRELEA